MRPIALAALAGSLGPSTVASAQGPGPWQMHDWMGWGWGGMWLGPLFMVVLLALVIVGIAGLVRWLAGSATQGAGRERTARDVLDERYARGEIDREEYLRRRDDLAGRS